MRFLLPPLASACIPAPAARCRSTPNPDEAPHCGDGVAFRAFDDSSCPERDSRQRIAAVRLRGIHKWLGVQDSRGLWCRGIHCAPPSVLSIGVMQTVRSGSGRQVGAASAVGIRMSNVAHPPDSDGTDRRPFHPGTNLYATASPRPLPSPAPLVVTIGSNTRLWRPVLAPRPGVRCGANRAKSTAHARRIAALASALEKATARLCTRLGEDRG